MESIPGTLKALVFYHRSSGKSEQSADHLSDLQSEGSRLIERSRELCFDRAIPAAVDEGFDTVIAAGGNSVS